MAEMDVREKLVELFLGWGGLSNCAEDMADYFIAHGVTVQEWISVKDRLPTVKDASLDGSVYAYTKAKNVIVLHYQYICRRPDYIFCWMPIEKPQPPNEVEQ